MTNSTILRSCGALSTVVALASTSFGDEFPKTTAHGAALVWVSAIEVWVSSDTAIVDTVWQTIDIAPVMTREHQPVYPDYAKKLGLETEIWVQALVGIDGNVHCAKISEVSDHGLEPGFELSALHAAVKNIFRPAQKNGRPAATWVTYPVRFRLS
jgi:TonB family protein